MKRNKTAVLFLAYVAAAGAVLWVISWGRGIVSILCCCAAVLGFLLFMAERRTGLTMREKCLPLLLLMALSLWGIVVWERTLSTVPMALAFTASYLYARSDSGKADWDSWDK